MPNVLSRMTWTKKARAVLDARTGSRFDTRLKLMGPSDGSGCRPPGEVITHFTRWRSTTRKAVNEAITYCDGRQIKITEFPSGFGY